MEIIRIETVNAKVCRNIYVLCTSGNAKMQQVPLFNPTISCQLTIGLIFLSFLQVVVFILFILLTFYACFNSSINFVLQTDNLD